MLQGSSKLYINVLSSIHNSHMSKVISPPSKLDVSLPTAAFINVHIYVLKVKVIRAENVIGRVFITSVPTTVVLIRTGQTKRG